MPKFINYKLEMELQAQMPIIHFQYNQQGATVRATEMKPKLDRYLIKLLKKEIGKIKSEHKDWFLDSESKDNNALNYKLHIVAQDDIKKIDISGYPRMFFTFNSNKGIKTVNKFGIQSNIKITIICFVEELREHIEKNLVDFFLVTNFGNCQNKGMGSYIPTEWLEKPDDKKKMVANAFKKVDGKIMCYVKTVAMKDGKARHESIANEIGNFISAIKSGANSYVRKCNFFKDFLGIHTQKTYKYKDKNKNSITVARLKSPLFFKVIENCIFVVAYDYFEELKSVNIIEVKKKGETVTKKVVQKLPKSTQGFLSEFIKENKNGYSEVGIDE